MSFEKLTGVPNKSMVPTMVIGGLNPEVARILQDLHRAVLMLDRHSGTNYAKLGLKSALRDENVTSFMTVTFEEENHRNNLTEK